MSSVKEQTMVWIMSEVISAMLRSYMQLSSTVTHQARRDRNKAKSISNMKRAWISTMKVMDRNIQGCSIGRNTNTNLYKETKKY